MLSVADARDRILNLAAPATPESVHLTRGFGRVLVEPVIARHDQPPFATATMDGYAIAEMAAKPGDVFTVIGAARAGGPWSGTVGRGQAVRIFTGAVVPDGAVRVVIQEDTEVDGDSVRLTEALEGGDNIRAVGADFHHGDRIAAPRRLGPYDLALAAAMNAAFVTVARRPSVAIIATGDELVTPGETPGSGQIIASNSYGLAALIERAGGRARILPIARDTQDSLTAALDLAADADLIVTIGGASVGDHDLVQAVAGELGLRLDFWKIAMRPGKPLIAGRLKDIPLIGLPGNPVSALVCAVLFIEPLILKMQGLDPGELTYRAHVLAAGVPSNGPRTHFMRARLTEAGLVPARSQDSALLSVMAGSTVLIVREPHAPAANPGDPAQYLPL